MFGCAFVQVSITHNLQGYFTSNGPVIKHPLPVRQPWNIWAFLNSSYEFTINWRSCACLLGYIASTINDLSLFWRVRYEVWVQNLICVVLVQSKIPWWCSLNDVLYGCLSSCLVFLGWKPGSSIHFQPCNIIVQYHFISYGVSYWVMHKFDPTLDSQMTPHSSPMRASYGVSVVSIWERIPHVITRVDCIWQDFLGSHNWHLNI